MVRKPAASRPDLHLSKFHQLMCRPGFSGLEHARRDQPIEEFVLGEFCKPFHELASLDLHQFFLLRSR